MASWVQRYPWAYKSSLKGGWICKFWEEYSKSGDEYWKTKARKHDRHPNEMFKNHLMSDKHKSALALRQNILNMTKKGNVISQITTSLKNSTIETRETAGFSKNVLAPYILWREKNGL